MENHNAFTTNPDVIRQVLMAQDEILQHLRTTVSGITENNVDELQKALSEKIKLLEEMEHRMWVILFPDVPNEYAARHRMTMLHPPDFEQYY